MGRQDILKFLPKHHKKVQNFTKSLLKISLEICINRDVYEGNYTDINICGSAVF